MFGQREIEKKWERDCAARNTKGKIKHSKHATSTLNKPQ